MKGSKVSDEKLINYIENGYTNAAIAREIGVTPGAINQRLKELRINHSPLEVATIENPKEQFDYNLFDTIVWLGKSHMIIKIDDEGFEIKSIGTLKITRFTYEDYAIRKEQFVRGHGAPVTVYHIEPERKDPPEVTKSKPIEEKPEFKSLGAIAPVKQEPLQVAVVKPKIDTSDDCKDYMDPEWGVTTGIESRILDKANREIAEFKNLKTELLRALDLGSRLPGTLTDKYNNIVSKYI